MWSDRTKKYINFLKERLAAFNKTDMEWLIIPGLEILEGKTPHVVKTMGSIIDADDSCENEQEMDEESKGSSGVDTSVTA